MEVKLLANENIPLNSVIYLISKGIDVLHIGMHLSGVTDSYVMELAIQSNRTIITFDKDYGSLIFKYGYRPRCGVILLRLESYTPDEPGKLVEKVLREYANRLDFNLTVAGSESVRQKFYG